MKRIIVVLVAAMLMPCLMFAAAVTNALQAITAGSDEIQSLITGALPLVGAVVVAALGIWLIPKAVRWIKSAVGK